MVRNLPLSNNSLRTLRHFGTKVFPQSAEDVNQPTSNQLRLTWLVFQLSVVFCEMVVVRIL